MKQTFQQANYEYIAYLENKEHLVRDISTNKLELFFANKNHASLGLIFKNTHLEFVRSIKA